MAGEIATFLEDMDFIIPFGVLKGSRIGDVPVYQLRSLRWILEKQKNTRSPLYELLEEYEDCIEEGCKWLGECPTLEEVCGRR